MSKQYLIMKDGHGVGAVRKSWDEVLEFFDALDKDHVRTATNNKGTFLRYIRTFDIVELGDVRVMKEWVSKQENGAGFKDG
jgi:hypothetical protein